MAEVNSGNRYSFQTSTKEERKKEGKGRKRGVREGRKEGGRSRAGMRESLIPLLLISGGSLHSLPIIYSKHFKTCLYSKCRFGTTILSFHTKSAFQIQTCLKCLKTTNYIQFLSTLKHVCIQNADLV